MRIGSIKREPSGDRDFLYGKNRRVYIVSSMVALVFLAYIASGAKLYSAIYKGSVWGNVTIELIDYYFDSKLPVEKIRIYYSPCTNTGCLLNEGRSIDIPLSVNYRINLGPALVHMVHAVLSDGTYVPPQILSGEEENTIVAKWVSSIANGYIKVRIATHNIHILVSNEQAQIEECTQEKHRLVSVEKIEEGCLVKVPDISSYYLLLDIHKEVTYGENGSVSIKVKPSPIARVLASILFVVVLLRLISKL